MSLVPIVVDVDKQMWLCSLKQAACSLDDRSIKPDKDTEPSLPGDLTKIVGVWIQLEQVLTGTVKMSEGKLLIRLLICSTHAVDSFNELRLLHVLGILSVWKEFQNILVKKQDMKNPETQTLFKF